MDLPKPLSAICSKCRHDLTIRREKAITGDGGVYCSNPKCDHPDTPHAMSYGLND